MSSEIAENYFSNLNSIAKRIHLDIDETKSSYERIWNELNETEQIDIINETLIKPEIALRYFDKFSSSSSGGSSNSVSSSASVVSSNENLNLDDRQKMIKNLSSLSSSSSALLLSSSTTAGAAVTLKNNKRQTLLHMSGSGNTGIAEISFSNGGDRSVHQKSNNDSMKMKKIYNYDEKNLLTYSLQNTGLKIIQDDAIGIYRDEHSTPFSFKTKSQINLNLFTNRPMGDAGQLISIDLPKYQIAKIDPAKAGNNSGMIAKTYQRLSHDHSSGNTVGFSYAKKMPLSSNLTPFTASNAAAAGGGMTGCSSGGGGGADDIKTKFLSNFFCKNNLIFNTVTGSNAAICNSSSSNAGNIGKSRKSSHNDHIDDDDHQHLINNTNSMISSLSIPSEEDEEKHLISTISSNHSVISNENRINSDIDNNFASGNTLSSYEESKLLLENDELRKGFDFLNNW